MTETILIMGGSVRSAAGSARRAGWSVVGADAFADRDLRESAEVRPVDDYPRGLVAVADSIPEMDWFYTGGLENQPALVDRISARHRLAGNGGSVLRHVRDPWKLAEACRRAGVVCPPLARDIGSRADGRRWLSKPLAGCGGRGIRQVVQPDVGPARPVQPGHIFQQFVAGRPVGLVYIAAGGRAVLVGVTEALVGTAWCGARDFAYAGSVGPMVLGPKLQRDCQALGEALAAAFDLAGLVNVDAILDDNDRLWPLEVNPRYSASVEVLERALGIQAVAWHMAACRSGMLPAHPPATQACHGKAILFAPRTLCFDRAESDALWRCATRPGWPEVADVPMPGTRVRAHGPACTVFATGSTIDAVIAGLQRMARSLRQSWSAQR